MLVINSFLNILIKKS